MNGVLTLMACWSDSASDTVTTRLGSNADVGSSTGKRQIPSHRGHITVRGESNQLKPGNLDDETQQAAKLSFYSDLVTNTLSSG